MICSSMVTIKLQLNLPALNRGVNVGDDLGLLKDSFLGFCVAVDLKRPCIEHVEQSWCELVLFVVVFHCRAETLFVLTSVLMPFQKMFYVPTSTSENVKDLYKRGGSED